MKDIIKDIMQTLKVVAVFVIVTTVMPEIIESSQVQMVAYVIMYTLATIIQNSLDR